jgi:glycosyltransferase involved in cell wall biosynthesis
VDCIVANSQAVVDFAIAQEQGDPERYRVIHNGIEATRFVSTTDHAMVRTRFNIPALRKIVGIVANFSPVKDHALFVEMAQNLIQLRADLHFVMVGTGALAKRIEQRMKRVGLEGCFTRIATVAELPDLYSIMNVVVLCSRNEGFPNAVMEAMAAGRPVVAANVGGIPEMITHGETGVLVNSRNPENFTDAVSWLLDNPVEAEAMGASGAEHVRAEFSVESMVRKYRALYSELLRAKLGNG